MRWAADATHSVFMPPSTTAAPAAHGEWVDSPEEMDRSLDALADMALAPWALRGITAADLDAAMASDPKVCTKLTWHGGWKVSRACDDEHTTRDGPVRPNGHHQEPWWRVRRRNSAIEILMDAAESLAASGTPVPDGTELVFCVGDCVATASNRDVPWRLTPVAKEAVPAFTLIACAGSDNIPLPVFMNRSNIGDGFRGHERFGRILMAEVTGATVQRPFLMLSWNRFMFYSNAYFWAWKIL
jgi:hypothetical protein